jgi:hypothetical protein
MKPTVNGSVVEPFDVVGTETVLFSVPNPDPDGHEIICVAALKS